MRQSIKIKTNDYNFKFRVSGLIIKENKLLLVDMDDSGFLCLPGGYVELGETTEEAMKRELLEEVGINFSTTKYLGMVENYFINKLTKKIKYSKIRLKFVNNLYLNIVNKKNKKFKENLK